MLFKSLFRVLLYLIILFPFFISPALGESFGVWPLFSYYTTHEQQTLEILGPLFTWNEDKTGTEWGIRPLLYLTSNPFQKLRRWEFLYPLGKYQLREGDSKFYVVPFSIFRDEVTSSAPERRERTFSFLTAFWGRTDTGERYGGFFPLAGQLKDRFGRDGIEFYLWPFYSRIEDEGEITRRVPWPFISLIEGKAEGLYIWPLWGYKERAGEYSHRFILWPFYTSMDEDLDTDIPVTKRYYLPFYATVRSPGSKIDIFIPPLFFHQHVDTPVFDKWVFPWPFLTLVKGGGVREWEVFPIFRLRDEEQKKRFYVLLPLYKYEWDRMAAEEETVRRVLLINRYRVVKDLHTKKEALDANIWPLFDYRRGFGGEMNFYVFPLLPLHDEGLERNSYPLLWVYRHTRSLEGEILSDFLWGLYRYRASSDFSSTQFAFLLRIEKKKGDTDLALSFFEGLIRYRSTPEGGKVGFFYLRPAD